jgi:exodeoxyribonuclease VII small subunit
VANKKTATQTESAAPESPTGESGLSFEESVRRLGEIVERLEAGELPLEDSIALFEQGILLSREAQARLNAAEKRVEQLLGYDENGRPLVTPIEPE